MSLARQVTSGVKWNAISTVTQTGIQFIGTAIVARLLSPSDFGLLSMALVIIGLLAAFADFGLSNLIVQRPDATVNQLSTIYWLNILMGGGLFILVWTVTPLVVLYYQEPALTPVLRWLAVSLIISALGQQFSSLLIRQLQFRTIGVIGVITQTVHFMSAIGLGLKGLGAMSLVWASLLSGLVSASILIAVAIRSNWLPRFHFCFRDLQEFTGFGLFQMAERSLNHLATRIDYLIIGRFLGAGPLGYYTLAYNLMTIPLNKINPIIVSVAFPAFVHVKDQDETLRRAYGKIIRYLGIVTFPMMATLFVVAPSLITVVYGDRWLPAVPVLRAFCLLGLLKTLGNPIGSLLLAKGRADMGFYMNAIGIVGYAISNWVGVRWGIIGVALSSIIFSFSVLFPIDFYLRWKLIRMTLGEFVDAVKTPALTSTILLVCAGLLYLVLLIDGKNILSLVTTIIFGIIVYLIAVWMFDRSLIAEVRNLLKPVALGRG